MPTFTPDQMARLETKARDALQIAQRDGVPDATLREVTAEASEDARAEQARARLARISAKIQARRAAGLPPAKSPFVEAALGYDVLGPGGLSEKQRGEPKVINPTPADHTVPQPARIPKAVRPGGLVAKYQESAAADRITSAMDRERGAE